MSTVNRFLAILAVATAASTIPAGEPSFSGTWCVGREGLVIDFRGNDSLAVQSLRDESVNGVGTYTATDSTLTATLASEDLALKMGYKYKWRGSDRLRAKILYFTVDGDSVNHPHRWLRMRRCDPETVDLDSLAAEEVKEEAEEQAE